MFARLSTTYSIGNIAIASQGEGFTGTPDIVISGGGMADPVDNPVTAVALMSCSALGPITHTSSDTFLIPPK
jgi:hypothetical protein